MALGEVPQKVCGAFYGAFSDHEDGTLDPYNISINDERQRLAPNIETLIDIDRKEQTNELPRFCD
jgi:hypothetical protein